MTLRPFLAAHAAEPVCEIALRLAGLPEPALTAEADRLAVELTDIIAAGQPTIPAKVHRGLVFAAIAEARDMLATMPPAGHA